MLPNCTLTLSRRSALLLLKAMQETQPLADETDPIHGVLLELMAALEEALANPAPDDA